MKATEVLAKLVDKEENGLGNPLDGVLSEDGDVLVYNNKNAITGTELVTAVAIVQNSTELAEAKGVTFNQTTLQKIVDIWVLSMYGSYRIDSHFASYKPTIVSPDKLGLQFGTTTMLTSPNLSGNDTVIEVVAKYWNQRFYVGNVLANDSGVLKPVELNIQITFQKGYASVKLMHYPSFDRYDLDHELASASLPFSMEANNDDWVKVRLVRNGTMWKIQVTQPCVTSALAKTASFLDVVLNVDTTSFDHRIPITQLNRKHMAIGVNTNSLIYPIKLISNNTIIDLSTNLVWVLDSNYNWVSKSISSPETTEVLRGVFYKDLGREIIYYLAVDGKMEKLR